MLLNCVKYSEAQVPVSPNYQRQPKRQKQKTTQPNETKLLSFRVRGFSIREKGWKESQNAPTTKQLKIENNTVTKQNCT